MLHPYLDCNCQIGERLCLIGLLLTNQCSFTFPSARSLQVASCFRRVGEGAIGEMGDMGGGGCELQVGCNLPPPNEHFDKAYPFWLQFFRTIFVKNLA